MLQDSCHRLAAGDPRCTCLLNAVFTHDSAWATQGVGKWANNPGNVRCLAADSPFEHECVASPGNGYFAKFPDLQTGIDANVELYSRKFRGLSADALTWRWANTSNGAYYEALRSCYK